MKTITLSDEQFKNLGLFLARVNLNGSEAGAFMSLAQSINSAIESVPVSTNGHPIPVEAK